MTGDGVGMRTGDWESTDGLDDERRPGRHGHDRTDDSPDDGWFVTRTDMAETDKAM